MKKMMVVNSLAAILIQGTGDLCLGIIDSGTDVELGH